MFSKPANASNMKLIQVNKPDCSVNVTAEGKYP